MTVNVRGNFPVHDRRRCYPRPLAWSSRKDIDIRAEKRETSAVHAGVTTAGALGEAVSVQWLRLSDAATKHCPPFFLKAAAELLLSPCWNRKPCHWKPAAPGRDSPT